MAIRELIDRWGDWALTLALVAGIEIEVSHPPAGATITGGRSVIAAVALLVVLPLAWRRRAPLAVLAAVIAALALGVSLTSHTDGVPASALVALMVAFYTAGAQATGRRSLTGLAAGLAAIIAVDALSGGAFQSHGVRPGAWLLLAGAWLVGREVDRRREEMRVLRERTADLEREREQRALAAAAEERARIARELHDVVAHSVSLMVVQSQAAARVLESDEPAARELLGSIEATGREALTELRRLLGLLRHAQEEPALTPQPSLRDLATLVDRSREAGLAIELLVEGRPIALPQGIDLSAYRIVQEGLTNALKHGRPAHARVVVRYMPTELEIEVSDDGDGNGNGNGPSDAGQGLIGMRERVTLYGGELLTGPGTDGGYVVRARLPLAAGV